MLGKSGLSVPLAKFLLGRRKFAPGHPHANIVHPGGRGTGHREHRYPALSDSTCEICSLTSYEKRDEAWAWLAWHWLLQALYWAVLAGILNNGCFTNTCLASLGRLAIGRHPTRTSSHGSQRSALRPAAGETACVDVAGGRGHMLMVWILFPERNNTGIALAT